MTAIRQGMDVIIITVNHPLQEEFWQKRLRPLRGRIIKPEAIVITIIEDWPSPPGDGLGFLYGFRKAQEKMKFMYGKDLALMQWNGAAIGLYQASGQKKSLFPLLLGTLNDPSALQLPYANRDGPITLLETVIAQTGQYAANGRLCVFRTDQIFIPSQSIKKPAPCHIEVLGKSTPFPTSADWNRQEIEKSPWITLNSEAASLWGRMDSTTFLSLVSLKKIDPRQTIALGLGPFSLSPQMTFALLREFEPELEEKTGCLTSEDDLWMPLTLEEDAFLYLKQKDQFLQAQHYKRMGKFKSKFLHLHTKKGFFGMTDLGAHSYLWDFGSTQSYHRNLLKLTLGNQEAKRMRLFFQLHGNRLATDHNRVVVDEGSCLIHCRIQSGIIKNSILIGVQANTIEADHSVLVDASFNTLQTSHSLLYHVQEPKEMRLSPGTIRSDVSLPYSKEKITLYSHQGRDSAADWRHLLPQNDLTFEQAFRKIQNEMRGGPQFAVYPSDCGIEWSEKKMQLC